MDSALAVLSWFAASILASELLGYLLHRLLHSGKIGFLSRSHMRHHMLLYGPHQPQRPRTGYLDATDDTIALGNIGLEWLVPGALLLAVSVTVLHFLRVSFTHQSIFVVGSLAWSFLMFSYLHDRMHIDGFWMERNPWLKGCPRGPRHPSLGSERPGTYGQELVLTREQLRAGQELQDHERFTEWTSGAG